jgi:hypothetical protein
MQRRRGSDDLGMQLGEAMARHSWHVDNLAAVIGADPLQVRRWLSGEGLPEPPFMLRLYSTLFASGSFEWLAFATAYKNARDD